MILGRGGESRMAILATACLGLLLAEIGRTDFRGALSDLTSGIVAEYFHVFHCVTYITHDASNWKYIRKENQSFLVKIDDFESGDFFRNEALVESYEQGCGGYVIQVPNDRRLSMVLNLKNSKESAVRYRYNKQRYLFLPAEGGEADADVDVQFFTHPIMFFFPNLLVLIPEGDSERFALVSHTTFDSHKRNELKLSYEILDYWSPKEGFEKNTNLYPNKIKNVRGKNLRFSLMHYVPYTLVLESGNETVYDGLEPRIAATFVEIINGTWDGEDNPVHLWGDIYDNGSANGILGAVKGHTADFGFAAIYQWNCEVLDCSYSYIQAGITCLVPRPQLISGWYTILIPFGISTWIALVIAYFLISCFVFFITLATNHIRDVKNPKLTDLLFESFYNVFRLQLEQIPKVAYKNSPISAYLRISTLYYYFVAAFWQGVIASVLLVPQYEKPIDTGLDLVSRFPQMKWGANHDSWILAISMAMDPVLRKIIDEYVILSDEELEKRPFQRDFGYFMERMPHGHFGFNSYITQQNMPYLRIMEKDIYRANVVTVMPRDCPYAEYYDHVLSWMFDTGIVHKMEDQVSLEMADNNLQLMIKTSNDKERVEGIVMALRHLEGALYIYALGISVSTFVFIIERFCFRRNK